MPLGECVHTLIHLQPLRNSQKSIKNISQKILGWILDQNSKQVCSMSLINNLHTKAPAYRHPKVGLGR